MSAQSARPHRPHTSANIPADAGLRLITISLNTLIDPGGNHTSGYGKRHEWDDATYTGMT